MVICRTLYREYTYSSLHT